MKRLLHQPSAEGIHWQMARNQGLMKKAGGSPHGRDQLRYAQGGCIRTSITAQQIGIAINLRQVPGLLPGVEVSTPPPASATRR